MLTTKTCGKKSEKKNAVKQGIVFNDSCTENCIKLRINANNKRTSSAQDNAISDEYGASSLSLSTLKCWTLQYPITKQNLETDYVMYLCSVITTELSYQQE